MAGLIPVTRQLTTARFLHVLLQMRGFELPIASPTACSLQGWTRWWHPFACVLPSLTENIRRTPFPWRFQQPIVPGGPILVTPFPWQNLACQRPFSPRRTGVLSCAPGIQLLHVVFLPVNSVRSLQLATVRVGILLAVLQFPLFAC